MGIAEAANHIWHCMVINNLADLECMERGEENGLKLADQALRVSHEQFGEDDWRSQRAAITNAYCQARAGEDVDTTALDSRLASIAGRWGEENLYSQRAIMQIRDIYSNTGNSEQAERYASRLAPWMKNWEPRRINNASSPF